MLSSNGNLTPAELECLRRFDTCTLSNAIERLNIRPRNEGFIAGAVTCRFPQLPPVIGYAVTARMRSSMMPIKGRCYYEHTDWWRYVASLAGPRIVVIQDAEEVPGGRRPVRRSLRADLPRSGLRGVCDQRRRAGSAGNRGARLPVVRRQCVGFSRLRACRGIRRAGGDRGPANPLRRPSPRRSAWSAHDSARQAPASCPAIAERGVEGDREIFELTEEKTFP